MKKIFTSFLFSLLLLNTSFSQTVQGTIKYISGDVIKVYAKPTTNITNQLGNINIVFSIPDQGVNNPTEAQLNAVVDVPNSIISTAGITNPSISNGRAYYTFLIFQNNPTTDVSANWQANVDNSVVTFTIPNSINVISDLRLEDQFFNGGGTNGQMYWYVQFNVLGDVTDYPNPFYGDGAVNNGGSALQFVPLQNKPLSVSNSISLKVTKKINDASINWSVLNEGTEIKHYEVERSFNGNNFSRINTTFALNEEQNSTSYEFVDKNITALNNNGKVFYRIKQLDKNNKFKFSEIRLVNLNSVAPATIFPNPAIVSSTLNFELASAQKVSITVRDINGKVISRFQQDAAKGLNQAKIKVNNLAKGNYNVTITDAENNIQTLPLIKL